MDSRKPAVVAEACSTSWGGQLNDPRSAVAPELGAHLMADTRRKVQAMGLWPKNLPLWPGDKSDRTPEISKQIGS